MSVDVAIGVVEGQVVAQWPTPTSEITFDAKNAFLVGTALQKAALEAYRGGNGGLVQDNKELMFIADQLANSKVEVTDEQRTAMINKVTSIIRSGVKQKWSAAHAAVHCVDAVLQETAR